MVVRIKSHPEEHVLYTDNEYVDWNSEYDWVEVDTIDLIKDHLPLEYEKYKKNTKVKKFNM